MEGPSLLLASEQLAVFRGKTIQVVSGNSKIGIERLQGKKVLDIFSWGKHLVFQFDAFALRVHFMLFGTFEAMVEGKSVTGDYRRAKEPRLFLQFPNGTVSLFNCSLKFIESAEAKFEYDFSVDVLSPAWDDHQALRSVQKHPQEEVADILLDQEIFAGVGNIIKNEVLFLTKTNPKATVSSLSDEKLKEIIQTAQTFSWQFYEWRKVFQLRAHLVIYQKGTCPVCGGKVIREKTGKRARWSYFCPVCQRLPQS
jgi:endonuclease-8